MKTAIILSDTHGNVKDLKKLIQVIEETDYIIHLGDGENDLNFLPEHEKSKLIQVKGNCDCGNLPSERVIEIEGVKIFMTHGHNYSVKSTLYKLLSKGKELDVQMCLYGHNHTANIETVDGICLVNPGTVYRYSTTKSYCYCVFYDGKVVSKLNFDAFI